MDQEVPEEIKEDTTETRHLNLAKHYKKQKSESKKRSWCCKSSNHFKRTCPYIRCFYCGKHAHMKKDCYMHKINRLLHKIEKQNQKKEKKKKTNKKKTTSEPLTETNIPKETSTIRTHTTPNKMDT